MKWQKRGLIYAPGGELWWARKYAMIPTVDLIDDRRLRIYFSSLDDNQYGRIGYVEVDAQDPQHILFETKEPVLDIGPLGSFDDCGVNASCIIKSNDKKYLYYIGWQRAERVPYMLFTGLAVSDDNGASFTRYSNVPILDRVSDEPYSRSAPFVLKESEHLKMWYWSCLFWSNENGSVHYNNVIKQAQSQDGISWEAKKEICIAPDIAADFSVGRPWVLKEQGLYKMWYSIRSTSRQLAYRIGYADSQDGLHWMRKDNEAGITVSDTGWDSEMICYPCVIDISGHRYMFYNGNRHGSTGFGYAVLEEW